MNINLQELLQITLQKGLPLALSFLDEAVLLILSNLGLQLPWLQWIGPILLTCTILFWILRFLKKFYPSKQEL